MDGKEITAWLILLLRIVSYVNVIVIVLSLHAMVMFHWFLGWKSWLSSIKIFSVANEAGLIRLPASTSPTIYQLAAEKLWMIGRRSGFLLGSIFGDSNGLCSGAFAVKLREGNHLMIFSWTAGGGNPAPVDWYPTYCRDCWIYFVVQDVFRQQYIYNYI